MKKNTNEVKVWDVFVRIFHWTLVGSVIFSYLSGEEFKPLHIRSGYFIASLLSARIIWGFVGTKYARFKDFLYGPRTIYDYLKSLVKGNPEHYLGHNPAGGLMIVVMLITLSIIVFTGLKMIALEGKGPLAGTDISTLRAAYADEDEDDDEMYRDDRHDKSGRDQKEQKDGLLKQVHELMTSFLILLAIVHVAGVITSSWIHKENLVMGMITGKKKKQ